MTEPNIYLPFEPAPVAPRVPANPSAEWLLAQWRERQATRFAAHATIDMTLEIGGKEFALTSPHDAVVLATPPGQARQLVALCRSKAEAVERAAELGTARCATGYNGWS